MATQSFSDLWAQRYKRTCCKAYQQILGFWAWPSFSGMSPGEMCRGEVVGRKGWVGLLSRKRCSFGGQGKMGLRKNTRYYCGGDAAVVSLDLIWVFFMSFS